MKLADWARKQGINYKTAYRLHRSDKLPRPTEQLPTRTILVHETPTTTNNAALYTRVSSTNQKTDPEQQMQRLHNYAAAHGLNVTREVQEIGSGLNGHRKNLLKLLADPSISIIVVEHKDRLTRFGAEFISAALEATNRQLQVINQTECKDDLVQDMEDALTSFRARLYGMRGARNRAKLALGGNSRCYLSAPTRPSLNPTMSSAQPCSSTRGRHSLRTTGVLLEGWKNTRRPENPQTP